MDSDDEARRILALARDARTPSADDKARVEARLALLLGVSSAAVTASTAAPAVAAAHASGLAGKAAGTAAALKWTLAGCALLAAALATYAALPRASAPAASRVDAHGAALPSATPPPVSEPPVVAKAAPAVAEPLAHAEPVPEPARAAHPALARAGRDTGRGNDALSAELELLHAAQSAWRAGDAARALALVVEHRARHPHSALGLERDALRVLALCDLGRKQEAVRLGRAWLSRATSSPLRASVEHSCAMQ